MRRSDEYVEKRLRALAVDWTGLEFDEIDFATQEKMRACYREAERLTNSECN